MFSQEIIEEIYNRDELIRVPVGIQSVMLHTIEDVLEKKYFSDMNKQTFVKDVVTGGFEDEL